MLRNPKLEATPSSAACLASGFQDATGWWQVFLKMAGEYLIKVSSGITVKDIYMFLYSKTQLKKKKLIYFVFHERDKECKVIQTFFDHQNTFFSFK